MDVPEEYGGLGVDDYRYNAIFSEEFSYVGASGPGFGVANELVVPFFMDFGTVEQKKKWLPKMAAGEFFTPLAMSGPDPGSVLKGIRSTAFGNADTFG